MTIDELIAELAGRQDSFILSPDSVIDWEALRSFLYPRLHALLRAQRERDAGICDRVAGQVRAQMARCTDARLTDALDLKQCTAADLASLIRIP